MHFVGKCRPEADALAAAAGRGFDAVELFLERTHLDAVTDIAGLVEDAPVDVASVHTPHATPEDEPTFARADSLADSVDGYLVVHTQYAQHLHVPQLDRVGFEAPYGYENNPGASRYHLEKTILDRGHDLVLDTGHLYLASGRYLDDLEDLLAGYADRIRVVHLTDATPTRDNLPLAAGDIDVTATLSVLREHHDGPVVLEVPPDDQQAALQFVTERTTGPGSE